MTFALSRQDVHPVVPSYVFAMRGAIGTPSLDEARTIYFDLVPWLRCARDSAQVEFAYVLLAWGGRFRAQSTSDIFVEFGSTQTSGLGLLRPLSETCPMRLKKRCFVNLVPAIGWLAEYQRELFAKEWLQPGHKDSLVTCITRQPAVPAAAGILWQSGIWDADMTNAILCHPEVCVALVQAGMRDRRVILAAAKIGARER